MAPVVAAPVEVAVEVAPVEVEEVEKGDPYRVPLISTVAVLPSEFDQNLIRSLIWQMAACKASDHPWL